MGIERPGGVRYFHIARELVRLGYSVRILALHPDLPNCPRRRYVQDGVEIWYVGQMHARKSGTVPVRFNALQLLRVLIGSTLGMIWGILCSPADLYHLGKPQPVNGLAAILALTLRGRRFYVDCDDDEVRSNRLTAEWQRQVFGFWERLLPRLAAGVTVDSSFIADRLRRGGVQTMAYVPNGADLDRLRRLQPQVLAALRESLGLINRRVIAYAGTLALHNHPVDLLLDAFGQLAADFPDLALLFIGGGEDLPELKRRARDMGLADRVYFTGQLPHESVHSFLALADLSVDPVHDDDVARARSPLKIFESMAVGVPIVTGDVGDRRALLADGAGVVTAPGDATALAETIRGLLDDPTWLRSAAEAAQTAARHYDWREIARRWLKVYAVPALSNNEALKQ
ncbi:MAG: glycosyltransferase family 4 protein [Chloroflexi bacterium]|nr:glycosyltransferase family 4 protein [Chloroflexota bacterium]